MRIFRRLFLHSYKHYLIATISCVTFIFAHNALRNFNLFLLPSGIVTGGLICALVGLLILAIFYGAFDTFIYGFQVMRKGSKREHKDLVEYTEHKARERKGKSLYYMPYIVVGILVAIVGSIGLIFTQPKEKLPTPTGFEYTIEEETEKVTLTWDEVEGATNGYYVRIYKYVYTKDDEDGNPLYERASIKEEAVEGLTYEIVIEGITNAESTKEEYYFEVFVLGNDKYNPSDEAQKIYPKSHSNE